MLSTLALAHCVTNGSVAVTMDDEVFSYWGVTPQANGDILVHLRHADNDKPFDLEVARADRHELYWEL